MYDICCIGHLTKDLIISPYVERQLTGGTAYYFSKALAKLDVRYALVTALATADSALAEPLLAVGTAINMYESKATTVFENKYGSDPDERTQRVLQIADSFSVDQVLPCAASVYHLGALLTSDFSTQLISLLNDKGRLSLDVQGMLRRVVDEQVLPADWDDKLQVLPMIHTLKASESEAFVLTGCHSVAEAAQQIGDWGVTEVVITMGSKGSLIYFNGKLFPIPAYMPTQVIDATGCGDTYMAGYLYQRFKEQSVEKAGSFAAAMATIKIATAGAFEGDEAMVWEVVSAGRL